MLASFGPGILILTPLGVTTPTPVNIGYAQGFAYSEKATIKPLQGQSQYPILNARGTIKPSAKVTSALISGLALNAAYYNQTFTSGGLTWNIAEAFSVPASSPYTYQTTNHTTFDADLGVVYAATGLPLQRVASLPTIGQYSTSAGTYTFAAADASTAMQVTYTSTVTGGQTLVVNNTLIGTSPSFQLDYYVNLNQPAAKPIIYRFYNCMAESLSMATKLEDFLMPEFEITMAANAAGKVYEMIFPEVS